MVSGGSQEGGLELLTLTVVMLGAGRLSLMQKDAPIDRIQGWADSEVSLGTLSPQQGGGTQRREKAAR